MKKEFRIKTLLEGFFNAFNVHKGFIPTIKDLSLNPKNVATFYIEGKTDEYGYNKYFSPGRFFVTVLAILSVFTFFGSEVSYDSLRELTLQGDLTEEEISAKEETYRIVMFFIQNPMFGFFLLILPASLSTRIAFKKLNYNLAKHLVVNIYSLSFIALLTGIISLCFNQQDYLSYQIEKLQAANDNIQLDTLLKFEFYTYSFYLLPLVYYCYSLKNIFALSWISTILRALFSLILSMTLIMIILIALIIICMKLNLI